MRGGRVAILKGRGVVRAKSQVVEPVKISHEARVVGRVGNYVLYNVVALGNMAGACPLPFRAGYHTLGPRRLASAAWRRRWPTRRPTRDLPPL